MPVWRAQGQLYFLYLSYGSLDCYPYTKLSRASATKNEVDVVLDAECWRRVVARLTHPASLSEQTRNSCPLPSPSSPSAVRRSTPALNVRHVACPVYSSNSGNEIAELRNKCIAELRVQLYPKPVAPIPVYITGHSATPRALWLVYFVYLNMVYVKRGARGTVQYRACFAGCITHPLLHVAKLFLSETQLCRLTAWQHHNSCPTWNKYTVWFSKSNLFCMTTKCDV